MEELNFAPFVIALLGGVTASILNWLSSSHMKRIERRTQLLEKQLKEVYGPIYLYTSHGKELYQIAEEIRELTKTNSGTLTQAELDKTIDARNGYIKLIWSNGEELKKLLASSYHLIDYDDLDKIQCFLVDYSRLQVEFD